LLKKIPLYIASNSTDLYDAQFNFGLIIPFFPIADHYRYYTGGCSAAESYRHYSQ
jgi:hypothetical protein